MPGKPLPIKGCTPLRDTEYHDFVRQQIATAKTRIWISMFTINATIRSDGDLRVRNLLKCLALAQRRGVDVRVLLGGDETVASDLWIANQVAIEFLRVVGLSVRNYRSAESTNSHSKVVLVDNDWLVLGSHNWSPRSLSEGLDDSIAICSAPMADELRGRFLRTWRESLPASYRADAIRDDYSPSRVFRRNVLDGLDEPDRQLESPALKITESMTGELIPGRSYVERFEDLAEQAQRTIKVMQFYFSYDGRSRNPPAALFAALQKAHHRGVRVEVLLDKDRKEDIYHSYETNRRAYQRLQKIGIDVKFDLPETVTHSKVVVIDDKQLVIGSHNWTRNSLARTEELSVLVDSPAVASEYSRNFDERFAALS